LDAGPILVKLGGSVITRKREIERLRPKVLKRLGLELGRPTVPGLLVLHGAGSFGHPGARRFHLAEPPASDRSPAERLRGGAIVAREVRRLHNEVLRALLEAGVPAYSLPADARNRAGGLGELDEAPFRAALAEGRVPVAFGDVVPDDVWGVSILSADTLALELGRRLKARRVVFVSDVPGVLPLDGAAGRPRPVPRLDDALIERLAPRPGVADVTGGIRRKAEVMRDLARAGVPAGLVGGLRPGAVAEALRTETPTEGTWAVPSGTD
jgi:isopentenyl phosphate kinase